MSTSDRVVEIIYDSVDSINRQLSDEQKLVKSKETVLIGERGKLDSLGLINFLINLEEQIEEKFQFQVELFSDAHIFFSDNTLQTIGTLADYIIKKIQRES